MTDVRPGLRVLADTRVMAWLFDSAMASHSATSMVTTALLPQ